MHFGALSGHFLRQIVQIPDASELASAPVPLPCELPLLGAELLEDPLLELPLELPVVLPALLFFVISDCPFCGLLQKFPQFLLVLDFL